MVHFVVLSVLIGIIVRAYIVGADGTSRGEEAEYEEAE